jgi:peptide deformylase
MLTVDQIKYYADWLARMVRFNPISPYLMALSLIPPTDPVLWTPAAPVTDIASQVVPLLDDMKALMLSEGGVGLAAPQIGASLAFFIMAFRGSVLTVINPRVISQDGYNVSRSEGCLSFPGRTTFVARREIVKAEWTDEKGVEMATILARDEARTFLHELDHTLGRCIHKRPTV